MPCSVAVALCENATAWEDARRSCDDCEGCKVRSQAESCHGHGSLQKWIHALLGKCDPRSLCAKHWHCKKEHNASFPWENVWSVDANRNWGVGRKRETVKAKRSDCAPDDYGAELNSESFICNTFGGIDF
jgi:hypothetical protein